MFTDSISKISKTQITLEQNKQSANVNIEQFPRPRVSWRLVGRGTLFRVIDMRDSCDRKGFDTNALLTRRSRITGNYGQLNKFVGPSKTFYHSHWLTRRCKKVNQKLIDFGPAGVDALIHGLVTRLYTKVYQRYASLL